MAGATEVELREVSDDTIKDLVKAATNFRLLNYLMPMEMVS